MEHFLIPEDQRFEKAILESKSKLFEDTKVVSIITKGSDKATKMTGSYIDDDNIEFLFYESPCIEKEDDYIMVQHLSEEDKSKEIVYSEFHLPNYVLYRRKRKSESICSGKME
ncbi:MAG: hypothetical protein HUJ68_12530 [Clostridia bacterium]|nr:hypothetical protein [Clostridia bacterium]